MLRIEMLPAHHGDALLIEYGKGKTIRRVLIDGGTPGSAKDVVKRLAKINKGKPVELELFVITHVDEDHIGGALAMMMDPIPFKPKDIWFNAWKHLFPPDKLGAPQGEGLTTAIKASGFPWNAAFDEKSVVVPDKGKLPEIPLAGGATITLLSPTWPKLKKMQKVWKDKVEEAGLTPGGGAKPSDVLGKRPPPKSINVKKLLEKKTPDDKTEPNGTSIAFLFEYGGKRILCGADAHPDTLISTLARYTGTPSIDAWKIAHHGSENNTSVELLDLLACERYLISTNSGTFGHPHPEAIARIVTSKAKTKTLYFNYANEYTKPWNASKLRAAHKYSVEFPKSDPGWLALDL